MKVYQHYKGEYYELICDAYPANEGDKQVTVYRQLSSGMIFHRPREEFHEFMEVQGHWRHRFQFCWETDS